MAEDTSCLFDLSETSFVSRMSVVYPKPLGLWQIPPLDARRGTPSINKNTDREVALE